VDIDFGARLDEARLEDFVVEYLLAQKLDVLPEKEFNDAVKIFVEKDEKDAIKEFAVH
jgi:double-strand break repair protein MRE11